MKRREFLQSGAALVIGFRFGSAQSQEKQRINPFNAWVKIDQQGFVTLTVARSDIGQGVRGSLPMILAEELEVDWKKIKVEQASTLPDVYGDQGTGGSGSVASTWLPLRRAGAAAREMLISAAAEKWDVGRETCFARNGEVTHGPAKWRLTYGELAAAASQLPIPNLETVPLKNPDEFHIVGTAVPKPDVPLKVGGRAIYGMDVKVPGMLYAVVARCPTFGGTVKSFNAEKAKAMPGVRHVVAIEPVVQGAHTAGGVAVVADTTWAALEARKALEIEWDLGPAAHESTESLWQQFHELADKPGKLIKNEGQPPTAPAKTVEAIYETPFLAHATMEPMNCTVHVRDNGAEVWAPTQAPDWNRDVVARVAGLKPEAVNVHTTLSGGGFGRRYQADFAVEAAQISKATGKPIKVVWSREDDMQHDFYRQATYHKMTGALDANGKPVSWNHRSVTTSIRIFWDPPDKVRPERQEIEVAQENPYAIPHFQLEYEPAASNVPRAWWRSVAASFNGYIVEGFIDEMAAAAGADPVAFRTQLLTSQKSKDAARLLAVLRLAATKANWGEKLPSGRGRGVACVASFDSYVAQVADVTIRPDGRLSVDRIVCAVDCGRAVDPDGVRAQMEGGIVYGLTAALHGEITIENGAVKQTNFDGYPMLRIKDMPRVEVHIVPSTVDPSGTGEPAVPVIAPAVCNAIYAATGKRVRRLPIRLA